MAGEVSKQDQALTRGAKMVADAKQELDGQLQTLRGQLSGLESQWKGAGSTAFHGVMSRWDADARRITSALDGFEENLRSSEQTYTTTDEAGQSSFDRLNQRLG